MGNKEQLVDPILQAKRSKQCVEGVESKIMKYCAASLRKVQEIAAELKDIPDILRVSCGQTFVR